MASRQMWMAALGVIGILGAGVGGAVIREQLELGRSAPNSVFTDLGETPLVASLEKPNTDVEADAMFYRVQELLEQYFVEPNFDHSKLAKGGIKSMIGSLSDPNAIFLDEEQFKAYEATLGGNYQGIGVDIRYRYDEQALRKYREQRSEWMKARKAGKELPKVDVEPASLVPDIEILSVIAGSPAEKAGLLPGDIIDQVAGKSVISGRMRRELQQLVDRIRGNKVSNAEAEKLIKEYDDRVDNSISPNKVGEKLRTGLSGNLKVRWFVGGDTAQVKEATIDLAKTSVSAVREVPSGLKLAFLKDAPSELERAVAGKPAVTLDLRNVPVGDFDAMRVCLGFLGGAGSYGEIKNDRTGKRVMLEVEGNKKFSGSLTLLVDRTTPTLAKIFALALQKKGLAQVEGELRLKDDLSVVKLVTVQDNTGYLLPIGSYMTEVKP